MKLYKTTSDQAELVVPNLEVAEGFFSRARGLLGRAHLPAESGLWIKPCNNIHTFFMKFAIDCVFLDKKMCINRIEADVKPYKIVGPFWKAVSVIELKSGTAETKNLKIGDQLYVVS